MDPRGHREIRHLLSDIGEDKILDCGDIFFSAGEHSFLIEIKEIGDLLNSVSSGRLYEQLRNQSEQIIVSSGISVLIIQGYYSVSSRGFLLMGKHETRWRYQSVEGILLDLALKGTIVRNTTNDLATAMLIRTLYNQLTGEKRPELRTPKIFSFRKRESDQLRIISMLPGINITLGRVLLNRFHTPRRIFTAAESELMQCPGINSGKVSAITECLDGWELT